MKRLSIVHDLLVLYINVSYHNPVQKKPCPLIEQQARHHNIRINHSFFEEYIRQNNRIFLSGGIILIPPCDHKPHAR